MVGAVLVAMGLFGSAPAAQAADLTATTSNFSSVFNNAKAGDVIHLAAGNYGSFNGGTKTDFVTIQADQGVTATMSLSLSSSNYLRFRNLTIPSTYLIRSHYVEILASKFTGAVRIDTPENVDTHVLMDGDSFDNINVCGSCYEGRLTVVGSNNTASNGIKLTNSHFSGGDADGVQITGNAYGTQIGPGNTFENIVMVDDTHTDPIQLYHSRHTQIIGNFLYRNETGIMAADGADHENISDNVFVGKADGNGYPWAVLLGADNGSTVVHNTLVDGPCEWSMRCGIIRIWGGNQGVASRGTIVRDNIMGGLALEDGSVLAAEDHNVLINDAARDSTDLHGKVTYQGGSAPSTFAGYVLASGSLGKGNASDAADRGFRLAAGPAPTPTPTATPSPSPTATPSPSPTATPSPSPTATPSPSPTATPSPTPTATPVDIPAKAVWTAPSGAQTGQAVTLDGTRSTGDAPITCTWSFENQDGSTVWETATGCKIQKTFANVDTKYVTLTVRDNDGDTDSSRKSFAVTAAAPSPTATPSPSPSPSPTATPSPSPTATPTPSPTATPSPTPTATPSPTPTATPVDIPAKAVWTAPSGAQTGQAVTLDGTRSTGDAPITCTWSFENQDGSTVWETATGCKIQKTFANADTKYVTLTVRDNDGDTDSSRKSFAVTAAARVVPPPLAIPAPLSLPGATTTSNPSTAARPLTVDSGPARRTALLVAGASNAATHGLVAALGFDNASSAPSSAVVLGAVAATGRHGRGLLFDGVNDRVLVAGTSSLNLSAGMTLEAWVKPRALGSRARAIAVRQSGATMAYGLYANSSSRRPTGVAHASATRSATGSAALRLNKWSHVATTYDGKTLRLYVNGVLQSASRLNGSIRAGSGPLEIGGSSRLGQWFAGTIDDVRVWNRPLSASAIRADMKTGV